MDLVEVFRVIRARWYVMVPLLLVTIALTAVVNTAIPTKYDTTSSLSLLASQSATTGTATNPGSRNPFFSFDSSLNDTADFLVRRLNSADAATDLATRGVTESYTVALAAAAQGPFITVTVSGTNREHVLTSINTLVDYTAQELEAVQTQAGVKPIDMIKSIVIVPAGPPVAQHKSKTQAVLGTAIGGLVVTFLATFVVESVLVSRRRKRRKVPFGATAEDYGDEYSDADSEAGRQGGAEEDDEVGAPARGSGSGSENGRGVTQADGAKAGAGAPTSASAASSSRWYGMDGAADLDRDPFEAARPELTVRTPSPTSRD
ncbi:MAG: hypothetical protein ACRDVE_07870 [Actinocrinis sp.]